MELILLKDVEKVGRQGEVVCVRDGFARNFLLPQKLALAATRTNRQFVEEQKIRAQARRERERAAAQETAKRLHELKVTVEARAGEQGKLFGSVTSEDISSALNREGFSVDRKQIFLKEPIRSLGSFSVMVELYPEVKSSVAVEVISKS